ncbi:MAG: SPOR domain-containing protein [Thermodesulfovibrionales bacterium]
MGMLKVLVIDEEKSSVSIFGKALEPRDIAVFVMDTPDKGIEKAIEIEPDLIFINLIFRESNGLKVSKLIHAVEKLRKVPIVMLLAHKSDLDPKYTTTIGVVDVLVSPLTTEDILSKTVALLGLPAVDLAAEKETLDVMPIEDELQVMVVDDAATAFPEWAGGQTPSVMSDMEPVSIHELGFTDEADKLIDQSIISPGDSRKDMFDPDDQPKDDVIHLRRPEGPEVAAGDSAHSDHKFAEEIAMEERNLFDEDADRKKDVINKSFEDELEESEKKEIQRHEPSEGADFYEGEVPEEEKPGTGKKVLMAIGGVVLIVGLGLGAYAVKKTYFTDETVRLSPPALKKEVVTENLPPAGAVNAPEKPETAGVPAPSPDARVLPPAAVIAKNEPSAPAVPAPAAIIAPSPAQKDQEKPKVASAKPAEQKPAATTVVKDAEKSKTEAPAKAAEKKEMKKTANELKNEAGQAKATKEKTSFRFAVQAGYFESEKNSEALVAKLKEKGYESYILKNEVSGKGTAKARTFYRVLIGKFDEGKKAAAVAREIKQKDNLSVVIYRR